MPSGIGVCLRPWITERFIEILGLGYLRRFDENFD